MPRLKYQAARAHAQQELSERILRLFNCPSRTVSINTNRVSRQNGEGRHPAVARQQLLLRRALRQPGQRAQRGARRSGAEAPTRPVGPGGRAGAGCQAGPPLRR